MKLLVSTRADENVQEQSNITHPILRDYAQRVGADFAILDHVPVSDSGDNRPHYRIMKQYELFDEYDRILQLDTDMLLHPECPNLFEAVPYEYLASVFEDKGSRQVPRVRTMMAMQQKFGDIGWRSCYINTGVFLASRIHKEIFQPINGEYWTGFGSDDVHLMYLIQKNSFPMVELPFQFNHMTMFSEPWNNSADRFKSFIIHYAGGGVFDQGVSNKIEQMKLDYKRWYK